MNKNWLIGPLHQFVLFRELVWEMTKRDLKMLHKGSVLGLSWLVMMPLIQVLAYVIIVSFIFGRGAAESPLDYCLYLLAGMLPWQMLAKSLQEGPTLLTSRLEILKQVIYPVETFPVSSIAISAIGSLVSLVVYIVFAAGTNHLTWTLLLLPIPLLILVVFLLGASWILSVTGVIFKDLREVVTITMSLLIYFTPVIAKESVVGARVWQLILCNPLSHVVIAFHDVFFAEFHPWSWGIFLAMSLGVFLVGAYTFTCARIRINDYL
jgi:lipopolysaccharide transport system permease protein